MGWESTQAYKPFGSLLPTLSSSQAPICSKSVPPSRGRPIAGISSAPRLQSPGLAALVRSSWRSRAELQKGSSVFGKPPDCARGCRGTRIGAGAGYLCRGRPSSEEAGKAAYGELARTIRLLCGRDIRGAAKACGSAVQRLAERRGATGNLVAHLTSTLHARRTSVLRRFTATFRRATN